TKAVFARPAAQADSIAAMQQEMKIRGRDIDPAVAEFLAIFGVHDAKNAAPAENGGHEGFFLRRDVNDDEYGGGQIVRNIAQDRGGGFDAAGRGPDDDHVVAGHGRLPSRCRVRAATSPLMARSS